MQVLITGGGESPSTQLARSGRTAHPRHLFSSYKDLVKEADKLWSAIILSRAGRKCEKCGSANRVQPHHVITRSNKRVRWNLNNGCCLCSGHHRFLAHMKPMDFHDWITGKRGTEWWDKLRLASQMRLSKLDMGSVVLGLKLSMEKAR